MRPGKHGSNPNAITDINAVGYDRTLLDPTKADPFEQAINPMVFGQDGTARVGAFDAEGKQIYDGGILRFSGGEHVVLGGTEGNDRLIGDRGIDSLWGDAGNDYLNAGMESDQVYGGDGDDIIEDPFGDDFLRGEAGDDVIAADQGIDLLFGGEGNDFIMGVTDAKEIFAGLGDDFILGGTAPDGLLGNEGDDWIEGGEGFDGLSGWKFDDTLIGATKLVVAGGGFDSKLTQAGVDRINGLKYIIGAAADGTNPTLANAPDTVVLTSARAFDGGEIILGGKGSDIIAGNLGNDILDGDAWLNIRISVHRSKAPVGANNDQIPATNPEIFTVNSLTEVVSGTGNPLWDGHSVADLMRTGIINPGQLKAVREILNSDNSNVTAARSTNSATDIDTAVFRDVIANYAIEGHTALVGAADINGDGFIKVTHTPPAPVGGGGGGGGGAIADGVDNIRNFEVLHFADGNIILKTGLANSAATGKLAIDITNDVTLPGLNVGDTVTAKLGTVADLDGLPALSASAFTWQFEQTPGAGDWVDLGETVRSLTITPLLGVDGNRLRAVGTFVDALGILESVVSDPTDTVAAQVTALATAGADLLVGTNRDNFISALAGDDDVRALAGNDIVIGGPGNDILDGGLDNGGLGDVTVFFGPPANFTFALNRLGQFEVTDAATGDVDVVLNFETILIINSLPVPDAQVAALVADLRANLPANGVATLRLGVSVTAQDVTTLVAGTFINDPNGNNGTPTGTGFDDVIFGNDGDDLITGLAGSDLLVGGTGDDTIDSGGGLLDIVSGGSSTAVGNTIRLRQGDENLPVGVNEAGSDTVRNDGGIETISVGAVAVVDVPNQTGNVVAQPGAVDNLSALDDGAGNLVVTVNAKTTTITGHFTVANNAVELIKFNGSSVAGVNLGTSSYNLIAAAAGTTKLNGGTGNDALFGTAAADNLSGGAGSDLLLGDTGNDTLNGGAGNDLLIGGNGADAMTGGTGDDIYQVDDSTAAGGIDLVTEAAGEGTDTVLSSVTYTLTLNVENLTLAGNNINGTGNTLDNIITGSAGNNMLTGLAGNDILVGGAGADIPIGGAGSDTIDMRGNDSVSDVVRFSATNEFTELLHQQLPRHGNGRRCRPVRRNTEHAV